MTLVTIVAGFEAEAELVKSIFALGARGYTATPAHGRGPHGTLESRFLGGDAVRIEVLAPAPVARKILEHVAEKYGESQSIIAYAMPVEAIGKYD